ncbi:hypothetical protein JD77_02615 [Micromonospora olivasterospora]|uniref:Uncharacterized protein n=1 Tax=Micromonospora olivasterospora TaxID=1880 RepID=A0A562IAA0_MICOL|nr:hypothetical protein JD77_02615 [Micromonospora olivasterospora]
MSSATGASAARGVREGSVVPAGGCYGILPAEDSAVRRTTEDSGQYGRER